MLNLMKSNDFLSKNVLFNIFVQNTILKFEYNCQIYDITNRQSYLSQQKSQDVLKTVLLILTKKKPLSVKLCMLHIKHQLKQIICVLSKIRF